MTNIIPHPATDACKLRERRLYWMQEAGRYWSMEQTTNAFACKERAAGLDEAICILGGEGISLCITDYLPA